MENESLYVVLASEVVKRIGTQTALAALLGVTQQSVSEWCAKRKLIPPQHVLKVEAATGISRHDLRPDIYPREDGLRPTGRGADGPGAGGAGGGPSPAACTNPAPASPLSGLAQ